MARVVFRDSLLVLSVVPALFRTQGEQALVEPALRQQLSVYAAKSPRPRLSSLDRVFWVVLSQCWPRWRSSLRLVQPETVIRWHSRGFRLYWRGSRPEARAAPGPHSRCAA